MSPLNVLFDLTIGKSAELSSAVIGVMSAVALAKAPIESLSSRRALIQILGLSDSLSADASKAARIALVAEAEELFDREKRWNLLGASALGISFAILIVHSLYVLLCPQAAAG